MFASREEIRGCLPCVIAVHSDHVHRTVQEHEHTMVHMQAIICDCWDLLYRRHLTCRVGNCAEIRTRKRSEGMEPLIQILQYAFPDLFQKICIGVEGLAFAEESMFQDFT